MLRPSALDSLLRLTRPRVLVLGDFMLDRYLYGKVSRISPEAPVPILSVADEEERAGGAAFTATLLAALEAQVVVMGVVGDDEAGRSLRQYLFRRAVGTQYLETEQGRATCCKQRLVSLRDGAPHQQLLRLDRDPSTPLHEDTVATMLAESREAVANELFDLVVVSDYLKGGLPEKVLNFWLEQQQAPVVVDGKPSHGMRYVGATCLKLNRLEAEAELGYRLTCEVEYRRGVRELRQRYQLPSAIITLGYEGMVVSEGEVEEMVYAPEIREVVDVTGAGDVVNALVGLGLASGLKLAEAAELAALAAGWKVGQHGAKVMTRSMLQELLRPTRSKLLSPEVAEAMVASSRQLGMEGSLVFTNGCFDVGLHAGHLQTLREASKLGDTLIVGLNSDASVRRLKGPGRPVKTEQYRAETLAALDYVDYVVVFDQDDPADLIRRLRPNVLVKGEEAGPVDRIPGAADVLSWGGRVMLVPKLEGHSTTATLKQLQESSAC